MNSSLRGLWWLLWFYLGLQPSLAVFFVDDLALFSAIHLIVENLIALVTIAVALHRGGAATRLRGLPRLVVLYFATAALSIVFSPLVDSQNLVRVWGYWASPFITSMAVVMIMGYPRAGGELLVTLGRAYVAGVLVGIAVFAGWTDAPMGFDRLGHPEWLHPNTLGRLAGIAVIATLTLPGVRFPGVRLGTAAVLGMVLAMTVSKTSIMATGLALGVWALLSGRSGALTRVPLILGLVGIIYFLFGPHLLDPIASYWGNERLRTTLSGRVPLWELTLALSGERLLHGYGFGLFKTVTAPYIGVLGFNLQSVAHAHNAFFTVLLEQGLLGAAVFVLLIARMCNAGLAALRSRIDSKRERAVIHFAVAVLVFLLVRSVTEASLNRGLDFVLAVGLATYLERVSRGRGLRAAGPG